MKLSEFRQKRWKYWANLSGQVYGLLGIDVRIDLDVAAAEASGKIWDPEEVELPKRLAVCFASRGEPKDLSLDPGDGVSRPRREKVLWYEEAARRYNNYEEVIGYLKQLARDFCAARQVLDSIGEGW